MSLDFLAIADALALRYSAAYLIPPTGQPPIRKSTARPENNAPPTPFVFVLLDDWEITGPASGWRKGELHFQVRLHHSRKAGDTAESHRALLMWAGVMMDATYAQSMLGLAPTVMKALSVTGSLQVFTYGGVEFDGVQINVTVWTGDAVTVLP